MAIVAVLVRSWDGTVLERREATLELTQLVHRAWDDERFPMLRWVDEYGDTLFSELQLCGVIPELERLGSLDLTPDERDMLGAVIEMARRCQKRGHSYLVLEGD
jgi:hypothetical protein